MLEKVKCVLGFHWWVHLETISAFSGLRADCRTCVRCEAVHLRNVKGRWRKLI